MQAYKPSVRNRIIRCQRRFSVVGLLCFCIIWACTPSTGLAVMALPPLTEDNYATETFVTQLPILVLEMSGDAREESDFFFEGMLSSYDGSAENTISAAPTVSRQASIRNMTDKTNSSAKKCDYNLRFEGDQNLLGLGGTDAYLLLGGKDDKSLIRNYLGYRIAAGIMEDAPGFELCEVFFRTEEGDHYQGVYLLVESKKKDTEVLFYHGTLENGIAIDTYSTLNNATAGRMYIPFLENPRWDDRYGEVIGKVSTAESVLYSSNSATFYTYVDLFDVASFVNRFILGELMEDYDGVTEGYFHYDTATALFSAAPVWNFEHALDNQASVAADVGDIRYDGATYYEQFFKSHQFATQVQRTYLILRRGVLNENALIGYVDEAAAYVLPAVQRDWNRWNAYSHYTLTPTIELETDEDAAQSFVFFDRQTSTFEDEILRLKFQLREHSLNMAFNLTRFDFSEKEISKEIVLNTNPVWPVLFLIAFFALVRFARRYGV